MSTSGDASGSRPSASQWARVRAATANPPAAYTARPTSPAGRPALAEAFQTISPVLLAGSLTLDLLEGPPCTGDTRRSWQGEESTR
ncbi:hypothetical protein GCM10027186_49610 [Micromonospora schwarzwaldensis]